MFNLYINSVTCDPRVASVFFLSIYLSVCLSISGRSLTVSLFFPEVWLGTSILKQFYTKSNIITNKLDEREMKKAADYLLSVENQMEGKRIT